MNKTLDIIYECFAGLFTGMGFSVFVVFFPALLLFSCMPDRVRPTPYESPNWTIRSNPTVQLEPADPEPVASETPPVPEPVCGQLLTPRGPQPVVCCAAKVGEYLGVGCSSDTATTSETPPVPRRDEL